MKEYDVQKKLLSVLVEAGLTFTRCTTGADAQGTARVRGMIERVDGPIYAVKTRDGSELKVALAENAQVTAVVKASLADIKQGSFVGVTAIPQTDGSQRAV